MFSICRKSFGFPDIVLHGVPDDRRHDFHHLALMREMAVMFSGQLLGENNTGFAIGSKYIFHHYMSSKPYCALFFVEHAIPECGGNNAKATE